MYIAIFELLIFLFGKILGGDPPAPPPPMFLRPCGSLSCIF